MSKAATDTAKENASLRFRVAFKQTIGRGPLVGVDLEIFGLDIDRDVFVGVFVDVDLGTDNPFEHLVASPGKFRFPLWHGIECVVKANSGLYSIRWEMSFFPDSRQDVHGAEIGWLVLCSTFQC